jgi:sugar-specific transcriptional regulator TrmB
MSKTESFFTDLTELPEIDADGIAEEMPDDQLIGENAELLQNLVSLGLTVNEAKVYLALVRRGSLTAVDAVKLSGVPRAKIYELLENLSAYGLCYETPGKKKNYTVVNPKEGLQRRIATARKELEMQERLTLLVRDQLMPLYNSVDQSSNLVSSLIHFLSNARLTASVYLKLLNEAEQEILFLSKTPYNVSIRASQPAIHAAVARGVKVRVLSELSECYDPEAMQLMLENQAKGVQLAVVPELPVKLIVGDQKAALLILTDTSQETLSMQVQGSHSNIPPIFSGMLIEHEPTIALLRVAFESFWQRATPLRDVAAKLATANNL